MPLFLPIMLFGIASIIHLLCPKLCQIYATYTIILCLVYHSNGRINLENKFIMHFCSHIIVAELLKN